MSYSDILINKLTYICMIVTLCAHFFYLIFGGFPNIALVLPAAEEIKKIIQESNTSDGKKREIYL